MKRFGPYLVGIAMAGVAIVFVLSASAPFAAEASSIVVTTIPAGYRDWKLISVAHEEANLNSFAAVRSWRRRVAQDLLPRATRRLFAILSSPVTRVDGARRP
jgi:hypothetical protein